MAGVAFAMSVQRLTSLGLQLPHARCMSKGESTSSHADFENLTVPAFRGRFSVQHVLYVVHNYSGWTDFNEVTAISQRVVKTTFPSTMGTQGKNLVEGAYGH